MGSGRGIAIKIAFSICCFLCVRYIVQTNGMCYTYIISSLLVLLFLLLMRKNITLLTYLYGTHGQGAK